VTEKNLGKALRHSLALAAFSLAVSSSASAQTPQDYPMWCRGATGLALSSGQSISVHFLPEKRSRQADTVDHGEIDGLAPWRLHCI
jgi:hypothetical protein